MKITINDKEYSMVKIKSGYLLLKNGLPVKEFISERRAIDAIIAEITGGTNGRVI